MQKILIATTNIGKFKEFADPLQQIDLEFVNLNDIKLDKEADEPFTTTWQNAMHKAKFYADLSGLVTIAEDTGFYVDYLDGRPGIHAKRFGPTSEERNKLILAALTNGTPDQRGARFKTHACVYDPKQNNFYVFSGQAEGTITKELTGTAREGMGFDSIFYYPPLKKTFAELTVAEKNDVSHRGQVIKKIKNFLQKDCHIQ